MINIVIPLAGANQYFEDTLYPYPKPLIEICGRTIIDLCVQNLKQIATALNFIFIVNEEDCKKFHLDTILSLLTDHKCNIIKLSNPTKGAACSVLMAIDFIDNDNPLIISNADQIFEIDLNRAIDSFISVDGGVITFPSVHPRWSYVKLGDDNLIIETAEKRPLSERAIAGFYFFKRGSDYVTGAMDMIRKDASINNQFYVAPVLNELILRNKKLKTLPINSHQFHTFYTPQKIEEYERTISK